MRSNYILVKLGVAFGGLTVVLLTIGLITLGQLARVNVHVQNVVTEHWHKVEIARKAVRLSSQNNRIVLQVFLQRDRLIIEQQLAQARTNSAMISEVIRELQTHAMSPVEGALLEKIITSRIQYTNDYQNALKLVLDEHRREEARQSMMASVLPKLEQYHRDWDAFTTFQGQELNAAADRAASRLAATNRQLWVLVGLGIVIAASIAFFTVGRLNEEIRIKQEAEILRRSQAELERCVRERTAELEQTHNELVKASRWAGMAEMAAGIFHNIGNALTSVNVSSGLISEQIRRSKPEGLSRLVALMREHEHDLGVFITTDAKGKFIPEYLDKLTGQMTKEHAQLLEQLQMLDTSVEHMRQLVAMQQKNAWRGGSIEMVSPVDVIEDALRLNTNALARQRVKVIREFPASLPNITVDKHQVLLILINLLRNAVQALESATQPEKKITLGAECVDGSVHFRVKDNGVGIEQQNLGQIFTYGFTTKKNGHGFGLHSCAAVAKQLGGSLNVESDGPGQGAAFTLRLPAQVPADQQSINGKRGAAERVGNMATIA